MPRKVDAIIYAAANIIHFSRNKSSIIALCLNILNPKTMIRSSLPPIIGYFLLLLHFTTNKSNIY